MVIGITAMAAGEAFLIAAPGNYRADSTAVFAEYLNRFLDIAENRWELLGCMFILIGVTFIIYWISKKEK